MYICSEASFEGTDHWVTHEWLHLGWSFFFFVWWICFKISTGGVAFRRLWVVPYIIPWRRDRNTLPKGIFIFCCLNGESNETKEIFNTISHRSLWLLIWQRRLLQLYEIAVYPTCQKRFVYQRGWGSDSSLLLTWHNTVMTSIATVRSCRDRRTQRCFPDSKITKYVTRADESAKWLVGS